jgi:succinate dehydrogenase flavin-adding protein (antitoxin of CptAB toxin-antitoxin module)
VGERDRILWHCRRGLLELDLILQRFMGTRFDGLSANEVEGLKLLLAFDDSDLFDLVMRRAEPVDTRVSSVLEMLRSA